MAGGYRSPPAGARTWASAVRRRQRTSTSTRAGGAQKLIAPSGVKHHVIPFGRIQDPVDPEALVKGRHLYYLGDPAAGSCPSGATWIHVPVRRPPAPEHWG